MIDRQTDSYREPSRDSDGANMFEAVAHQRPLGRLLLRVVLLGVFTFTLTWLCRGVLDHLFDLKLDNRFWHRDFLGNLVVALLCFALVQKLSKAMILSAVLIIGFQMANGGKLSVLGTPASPDDFLNIQNLFFLTDGWRRAALMLIAALPLLTALALIPFKKLSSWIVMGTLACMTILLGVFAEPARVYLDTQFGNSVWNQPENFKRRGLALHLAQESIRTAAKVGKFPDRQSVDNATQELVRTPLDLPSDAAATADAPVSEQKTARNVHVIVLESFFDPVTLGSDWVPEDPFPASFRQLWAAAGHSKALSPVFGGYTANAEFETLCGFPVTENAVFFEGWLRRSAPCLPAVLAQSGYSTIASHPNVPGFWNRTHAYHLVGFDRYLSKSNFDLTDSVQGLLLDHSFFEQVYAQLPESSADKPVFNYMLTYHGHLPYPSSEAYPDKVKAGQEASLLHGYLNQLWYKSRDLMETLDTLQQRDPDALIVVFGDHLPFLGQNYGVYTEALGLPDNRANFTGAMLQYLVSTPLIVIDGQRGPLKTGDMPLYRLPSLILSLLGLEDKAGILDWTRNPPNELIRPVYGMHIAVSDDRAVACPDDDSAPVECQESGQWLSKIRVLIGDLFSGKQYGLKSAQPAAGS